MLRPEDCIPGTLVECIDDRPRVAPALNVVRGRIYTIQSVFPRGGGIAIRLVGVLPVIDINSGVAWHPGAWRFRLIPDERLSIFRAMLAPAPQKERV